MDLNDLNKLSQEEIDFLAKNLVLKRLSNKEQLKFWLLFFLGVDLADNIVSRYSTSCPLDMVWDIYNLCASDDLRPKDLRYIAGRSSQKTLSLAVLKVLLPLHFKRSVVHFGGTVVQANRAYSYFNQFVRRPYISSFLKSEPTQKSTVFLVDGEEVSVEILSISPMSVQGAHAPIVSLDELASLTPDKVKSYSDIKGVPSYTKDGKPWYKFGISSRKGAYTVIEEEYRNKDETGIIFKFWTVLENTQHCPDSISGTEPLDYYVDIQNHRAITLEEYKNLDQIEASKFELVHARKNCFTCPLKVVCAGDLKKQKSSCRVLRPVYAVIEEFKLSSDYQWYLSQMMSLTPSVEGLVFPKFKRDAFEKTPNELYKIFMGHEANKEITEKELIDLFHSKGLKCYAGLDHGYTDPLAIVIAAEDSRGCVFILHVFAASGLDPDQIKLKLSELQNKYKFTHLYPDPSQPAINQIIRKAKICKVVDDFDKKGQIENGIALIRQKLNPISGAPLLYGLKGNVDFLCDELEKYHFETNSAGEYLDTPSDEFNHAIDALRYMAINRWKSSNVVLNIEQGGSINNNISSIDKKNDALTTVAQDWFKKEIETLTGGVKDPMDSNSKPKKGVIWDI